MLPSIQRLILMCLVILVIVIPARGLKRTIGPPNDRRFINASRICNADVPESFEFRTCSLMIDCVYDNITEAFKASLASGTSIVALLPTILALIGAPPLEIVQLALVSPHRALATCCFTIGLPSGLFRQLRPIRTQLSTVNPREPRIREWTTPLSSISKKRGHNLSARVAMDIFIMSLASIMLWRNWVISSFTMIPWRCEYSWLVFAWPIACMSWLVTALILVFLMKESVEAYDGYGRKLDYSIWYLIRVPYMSAPKKPALPILINNTANGSGLTTLDLVYICNTGQSSEPQNLSQAQSRPTPLTQATSRNDTIQSYNSSYIRVRITMPTNFGFRSWRCYEAVIESLALGIYMYATFVLTSIVFLNADKAIVYATVMTTCLSAVRVLTTLF